MIVSEHGTKRVRARLGIPKKSVEREAERALTHGKSRHELSGSIRRYLDRLYHNEGGHGDFRIWNGSVFIFRDGVLATAWPLPGKFRNTKAGGRG